MLSIYPIQSVSHAAQYYCQENKYLKDTPFEKQAGVWWGSGVKAMRLGQVVKQETFTRLLSGQLPNGQQLGRIQDGELKHRGGLDLTFAAPKSVSLLALIGQENRLITAHNKAVNTALAYLEEHTAITRVMVDGQLTLVNTQSLVVAKFLETTSRENDPHLHTHAVVLNMTRLADGRWRSLSNEEIYRHKMAAGVVYRAQLAYEARKLGYAITHNNKGLWEIDSLPERVLEHFSKRRQQIEQGLSDRGVDDAKSAAIQFLLTRKHKSTLSAVELNALWQNECQALGFNIAHHLTHNQDKVLSSPTLNKSASPVRHIKAKADKAVLFAIEKLSEAQSILKKDAIEHHALQSGIDNQLTLRHIKQAIDRQIEQGLLMEDEDQTGQFITPELLRTERTIVTRLQQGKNCVKAMSYDCVINRWLDHWLNKAQRKGTLNLWQANAARMMVGQGDRYVGLTHFDSKRDGQLLQTVAQFARQRNIQVRALMPSQKSAQWFSETHQIAAFSVTGFLAQPTHAHQRNPYKPQQNQGGLWFIWQAEKLSSVQIEKMMTKAERHNARVVWLLGENKLRGTGSGYPMTQLMRNGMRTLSLNDGLDKAQSLQLVGKQIELNQGLAQVASLLDVHHSIEISASDERVLTIATAYQQHQAHHDSSAASSCLILAPKAMQATINAAVRQTMKQAGMIDTTTQRQVMVWVRKYYTTAELKLAHNYQPGDRVKFHYDYRSLGIVKNDTFRVHNIVEDTVTLLSNKQQLIAWQPDKVAAGRKGAVSIWQSVYRDIAVGDRLRWLERDNKHVIVSGDSVLIHQVTDKQMVFKLESGKTLKLSHTDFANTAWDYAYTTTASRLPPQISQVLVYADSQKVSWRSCSELSAAMIASHKPVKLYIDNRKAYHQALSRYQNDVPVEQTWQLRDKASSASLKYPPIPESHQLLTQLAEDALSTAIDKITEREAVFGYEQLVTQATIQSMAGAPPDWITAMIESWRGQGELLATHSTRLALTTPKMLEMEQTVCDWVLSSQDSVQAIDAQQQVLQARADNHNISLNQEQQQAAQLVLTTQHQVVGIQGYAGTGKTTLLKHIKAQAQDKGFTVLGLAPSAAAAQQLTDKAGISSQTVERFLGQGGDRLSLSHINLVANTLLIVDESSMLSTRQFYHLQEKLAPTQAHLALVGDSAQLEAVEAGKLFSVLQQQGMPTARLTEIIRQQQPHYREAVYSSLAKDMNTLFTKLGNNLKHPEPDCIDKKIWCQKSLMHAYNALSSKEQAQTLVVALTRADCEQLNHAIRDTLKQSGQLEKIQHPMPSLQSKNLTTIEKSLTMSYQIGDVIRFNQTMTRLNITPGDYIRVITIDNNNSTIILEKDNRDKIQWRPHQDLGGVKGAVEVYQSKQQPLAIGERIRWRRNDEQLGLINGQQAMVIHKLDDQCYQLQSVSDSKQTIILDSAQRSSQHWDYAYVSTVHSAQGDDKKRVLVYLSSDHRNLNTWRSFYVAISRGKEELTVFVDNKEQLINNLKYAINDKTSSLAAMSGLTQLDGPSVKKHHHAPEKIAHSSEQQPHNNSPYQDIQSLCRKLEYQAEQVAIKLLGKPKARAGHTLKFGSNQGSLHVEIAGERQGLWYDFQEGKGGHLFNLIQEKCQGNIAKTIETAHQLVGGDVLYQSGPEKSATTSVVQKNCSASNERQQLRIQHARKLFTESQPIRGTLGERYLSQHRGITQILSKDLRFHPAVKPHWFSKKTYPAVVLGARNQQGDIQAAQCIFLNDKTAQKAQICEDLKNSKLSYGMVKGAALSLGNPLGPVIVAEGPETGLSVAMARPDACVKVSLSLSNMSNVPLGLGTQHVLIAADNDGDKQGSKIALDKVVSAWKKQGVAVDVIKPQEAHADFNDVLQRQGLIVLKEQLRESSMAIVDQQAADRTLLSTITRENKMQAHVLEL